MGHSLSKLSDTNFVQNAKKNLKNMDTKFDYNMKNFNINLIYKYPSKDHCLQIIYITENISNPKKIVKHYDKIFKNFYQSIYNETDNIAVKINDILLYYILQQKIKFNAPRPLTVCERYNLKLNIIDVKSAHTPSFPSGHTVQYYGFYLYFSTKYPENKDVYYYYFIKGSNSRVIGGLHFFEDLIQGVTLVNQLYYQSEFLKKHIDEILLINPTYEMFYNNIFN